jgi:mRNA interferase RelE/StbE
MYALRIDEGAMKHLEKLPQKIGQRIFRKLQDTREDPHRYFEKLTNRPEHRLRIGTYRVFADIDDTQSTISILDVRHRKSAYRKR